VLGVAIGFGAQNVVQDFLAGIFMMLEDQCGVGDVAEIGKITGTVEAVSLRITRGAGCQRRRLAYPERHDHAVR
jgi:small-conductance mechanosensitive channel